MAFDKWTPIYSALLLLVSSVGNIAAQSCGFTYTKSDGVFTSPNYPDVYDINSTCTYTISLTTISSITLNFETFELDRSAQDYVLINCEGSSDYAQYRYLWNSNTAPISITLCSSGRLYFYSDPYRNYTTRGFKVQYQVSTKECGNTVFTSSSGNISSPNYPQSYNNDENCTYSIWAPETSSFTLTFQAFNLQSSCGADFIQIKCDDSSYILPKYCGSTLPKPAYISNCNRVLIWFHTDGSGVYSGFSLQYSVTPYGCGKLNYAGLSGIITSPNYPNAYSSMSCNYDLYPVSSVSLAFQSFDLEPFIDNKMGDFVQIECTSDSSYPDYKFNGNSLPSLISYTRCSCIRLYFFSNYAVSGAGFNVKYQVYPSVAHSAITYYPAPKSITVNVGSRVDLYCRSNATGNGYMNYPSWTLSIDGTDENTTVIVSFCYVNPGYTSQYSVHEGSTGHCDLVITSATLAQTGIYTCIDVGLASASTVVTVVEPTYEETDPNVTVIVLSVLLAICVLGYIVIAIFCIVRRRRKTSREDEGQRNTNLDMGPTNDSVETQATGSVYEDPPVRVLSPKSSTARTQNDEYGNEHLNHGYDKPPAYDL